MFVTKNTVKEDIIMKTPFLTSPAVFAAGSSYQIMAVADIELLYWVEVNGRNYYDSSNGEMCIRDRP